MGSAKGAPPDAIDLGAISLPVSDYASQGNAILGIRDSGKSYTATLIAEHLLCQDIPFVAFDPIGVWRFLRHKGHHAGGRSWDVLVAGEHGDVPLTPENCESIVRHAMTKNLPLVLDLYAMSLSKADWRRIVQKCVRLLLYENKTHGLRHVFIEEAAEFVPQMVQREHGEVYAEIEKLARMGGNAMLGYTLINQRAEQVNKAVLELCDCLFLHRQKGRLSLTALSKWLDFGDKKASTEVISSLPMLPQGDCWVWPNGAEKPIRTRIPRKQSFHPNRREITDAGPASDVKHMLAGLEIIDQSKKSVRGGCSRRPGDPMYVGPDDPREWPKAEPEKITVPVFADGDLAKLHKAVSELGDVMGQAQVILADLESSHRAIREALARADAIVHKSSQPRQTPRPREANKPTVTAQGPQRILSVLAGRHPLRLTQAQLGTMTGFTPSTMRTYLPRLREAGHLSETADGIGLSEIGCAHCAAHVPKTEIPTHGKPLLEFWQSKLSQGEGAILGALYEAGLYRVGPMTTELLSSKTGYTESTLRTYIPTLRRNNLIDPTELRIKPEFLK